MTPDPDAPTLAELSRGLDRVEAELRAWRSDVATAMEARGRDTVSLAVWQVERAGLHESIAALRSTVEEERRNRQSAQRALVAAVVATVLGILGQYVQFGSPITG